MVWLATGMTPDSSPLAVLLPMFVCGGRQRPDLSAQLRDRDPQPADPSGGCGRGRGGLQRHPPGGAGRLPQQVLSPFSDAMSEAILLPAGVVLAGFVATPARGVRRSAACG